MPKKIKFEVPAKQLRWRCNPKSLGIKSTDDVESSREIIGQPRALRSLRLGLEMKHPGYNVFVSGYTGTGRMTTIKMLLAEFEHKVVPLRDHCYLFNFKNVDQPMLVSFAAGQGKKLSSDLADLLQEMQKNIPSAFDSRRFQEEKKKLLEHFQARQRTILKDFEKKVKDKGFEVVQVQVTGGGTRPDIAPVVGNQPVNFDQLDNLVQQGMLTKQQMEHILADRGVLESSMELVLREMRNIDRKAKDSLEELNRRYIAPMVKGAIEQLIRKYDHAKLTEYFHSLEEEIMGNLDRFRPLPEDARSNQQDEDAFLEFSVNVLVDNSESKGIPIIIETNPKFKNLFGTIEREIDKNGVWRTDFTLIKPGSLLAADGGFLVINALDALSENNVWQTLKRTLRNGLVEIQSFDSNTVGSSSALKPEPIALDVKVVMIGDAATYYVLYDQDDDFKKIFKVRADFDVEMPKENHAIKQYITYIKMVCERSKLLPFDASGVASIIEYGARIAGRQDKLTTRFNEIADLTRESSYWASKAGATMASAVHVQKAINEHLSRVNMVEDKIQELIMDGTIMIDSDGAVVGQVNGLSVYDMGDHSFGRPARITVGTALGKQGIINIEREASMSGPSHNKGVLILSGYLRSMYAQNKPLALSASIAFEQSYNGVDGDSATSTEVYAILSSISKVPLRQDIAVTGSLNQKGEIQPIGGVNQKVEGFYDICKARGLTGAQGVLIPHQNISELMIRQDIIEAVEKGQFRIYAIKHIDEGIEILTGMKAGKRLPNGGFEKGSVHDLVDTKLTEYAERWRELSKE